MPPTGRKFRLSVQTKVLIPVLVFLVLLPAATVAIVGHYIDREERSSARDALLTAESVFRRLLENQQNGLLPRYANVVSDPRLVVMLRTPRTPETAPQYDETLRQFCKEIVNERNEATVILLKSEQVPELVGYSRSDAVSLDDFARVSARISGLALKGEPATDTAVLNRTAFAMASLPVRRPENGEQAGFLTVGVPIGDAALQELKRLTNTEIFLTSGDRVIGSTRPALNSLLISQEVLSSGSPETGAVQSLPIVINGEHFLALTGTYSPEGDQAGFRYVLLSSIEASLQVLAETQRALVEVSVIGILLSTVVVWIFVRRIIRPLRELRDTAEAVGRGDFSRRVGRFSNDECGDLSEAFNHMTANLRSSHAELEKTVETLKATQHQLIQSEKLSAVGQFVAGVAHELNNPLAAVIGFSDLLVHTGADAKVRPHLELIAKSAHRCHKIVQNLLSFARQHPPERTLIQINGTIEEILEIMAYDFRTSNITIVREFQEEMPAIMADPHQLQQVFVNILGNGRQAIEAFRPDGQIIVRTRAEGRMVRVEFVDNGPGIRPENLARIFDPFFTTKPVGKGTGLGLSLSYGIVQEHGGRISARSELGNGATFLIELPIAEDAPAISGLAAARSSSLRPKALAPSGKAVLVVDDEEWILTLARELIANDGHEVETVLTGEQAIAALRRRRFDVVVCDWKMPGLNGIQFYEHLLATDPAMAGRVLFMSGDIINDTFQEFLRRNGKVCLPKPFAIEDFQDAVTKVLEASAGA